MNNSNDCISIIKWEEETPKIKWSTGIIQSAGATIIDDDKAENVDVGIG